MQVCVLRGASERCYLFPSLHVLSASARQGVALSEDALLGDAAALAAFLRRLHADCSAAPIQMPPASKQRRESQQVGTSRRSGLPGSEPRSERHVTQRVFPELDVLAGRGGGEPQLLGPSGGGPAPRLDCRRQGQHAAGRHQVSAPYRVLLETRPGSHLSLPQVTPPWVQGVECRASGRGRPVHAQTTAVHRGSAAGTTAVPRAAY